MTPPDVDFTPDVELYDFIGHLARAATMYELQRRYLDGVGRFIQGVAAGLSVPSPSGCGTESCAATDISDAFRHEMHSVLEAPVRVDGVTLGTLVFGRTEDDDDFDAGDHMMVEVLAQLLGVALISVRERIALARERDQTLAALELCSDAVIVTDYRSAERRMNFAARRVLARLEDGDTGLDDLLSKPARIGETIRHEAHVALEDGSLALLSARSTNTEDDAVLITFLELVSASEARTLSMSEQHLTRRERQVAQLAAGGLRDAEIAVHLHLSRHTVKQYLKTVYSKLGVRSRVDLTRLVTS